MKILETKLPEVIIILSDIYKDERGFFSELLNLNSLKNVGIDFKIAQVNHSYNKNAGILRGLHFQTKPFEQAKIVTCLRGAIFDVAVDIRPHSSSFLKYTTFLITSPEISAGEFQTKGELSYDFTVEYPNKVFIPKGFAHGYLTLAPSTEVIYFTDNFYSKKHDKSIRYNDPEISIPWPKIFNDFCLSKKDANAPFFKEFDFSQVI